MILVDTSVWIDHLHNAEPDLVTLLDTARVSCHPFVIGELACGRLKDRDTMLDALSKLPAAATATHDEALAFLEGHQLAGQGIGSVDLHLLASAAIDAGTRLWTRDKRLARLAQSLELQWKPKDESA